MIANTFLPSVTMIYFLILSLMVKQSHSFVMNTGCPIITTAALCTSTSTHKNTFIMRRLFPWNGPKNNNIIDTRLFSNHNDADSSSGSKKRRKRKDGKNVVVPAENSSSSIGTTSSDNRGNNNDNNNNDMNVSATTPTTNVNPISMQEKDAPKQITLQIMDVRDVVSGKSTMNVPSSNPDGANIKEMNSNDWDNDEDDDDDDEYEYYYEDENGNEIILDTANSISTKSKSKTPISSFESSSSSLDDILADARRLRQEQKDAVASGAQDPEELSIPKLLKGAISNIVTVDFFLVCGLLLWFLAGIFCSYVLKDDTVQIAFNMQFERVVQPALGILMIGAAAGAVFKEPSKEEEP